MSATQPTAELTERDTVTAAGEYDLSAIMRIAARSARREAARYVKAGFPANYASALRNALRNVWNFARCYRWTIRQRIAREAAAAPVRMQEAA